MAESSSDLKWTALSDGSRPQDEKIANLVDLRQYKSLDTRQLVRYHIVAVNQRLMLFYLRGQKRYEDGK